MNEFMIAINKATMLGFDEVFMATVDGLKIKAEKSDTFLTIQINVPRSGKDIVAQVSFLNGSGSVFDGPERGIVMYPSGSIECLGLKGKRSTDFFSNRTTFCESWEILSRESATRVGQYIVMTMLTLIRAGL